MPPPPPRSEIDHTKRPLLTHTLPPPLKKLQKNTELLGGGEGVITFPLPCGEPEKVAVREPLLFSHRKMFKRTKKKERQI